VANRVRIHFSLRRCQRGTLEKVVNKLVAFGFNFARYRAVEMSGTDVSSPYPPASGPPPPRATTSHLFELTVDRCVKIADRRSTFQWIPTAMGLVRSEFITTLEIAVRHRRGSTRSSFSEAISGLGFPPCCDNQNCFQQLSPVSGPTIERSRFIRCLYVSDPRREHERQNHQQLEMWRKYSSWWLFGACLRFCYRGHQKKLTT